ncbi:MAG: hypothetical protein WDW38_000149 [Sanguina aurantia]
MSVGSPILGLHLLVAGAITGLSSSLGIRARNQGTGSRSYTAVSALAAVGVARFAYRIIELGKGPVTWYGALMGLSSLSALFCAYNMLTSAGPRPTQKPDAEGALPQA